MNNPRTNPQYRLAVNSYDRASSLLVALLVIGSVTVASLLIVYFARKLIAAQVAIPVQPVDLASRPADAAMGLKRDLEPPGMEEVPDLLEPQLQDTLTALSDAVTSKQALLSDEAIDSDADLSHGSGLGDNRQAGLGGEGDGSNDPQRDIRFEPANLRDYGQYLDFFGFELGLLGRDNKIHYAYNLSQKKPSVRTGTPTEEKRPYMNSAGGPFAALDRRLASKAGLEHRGLILLQFYPPETQVILLSLEQQHAAPRQPSQIRRTVFRVTRSGDQYTFSVEEQTYR